MAAPLEFTIPDLREWDAHGQVHADAPGVIDANDGDDDPRGFADVFMRQDAQIQEENGQLGEAEAEIVAESTEVRPLGVVCARTSVTLGHVHLRRNR